MTNLDKIFELWFKCTGKDIVNDNKIRIGLDSDWLCHKAKSMLEKDPSGLLSGIAMRSAFRKLITESYYTIEQLLNNAWADENKANWEQLRYALYEGVIGKIVDDTITDMTKTINNFGRNVTKSDIESQDVEKIFVDAFDNFRTLVIDTFKNPVDKSPVIPKIVNKLFRFDCYKDFIDALRNSSEDNIITVSIIDRTYAEEKGEYAEKCDKFFAFGCKYNGGIIVISDRVDRRSPSDSYGTRNPYRDINNKIDFSHLPYHRLKQIYNETAVDNQLLLPAPSSENTQEFCSEFDLEGYIYITAIISIIVNKYFKNDNWKDEVKVFGSDLKFITAAESKALVKLDDNMVTLPDNNTTAKDYPDKDKVYNTGMFDFYIDEHPITGLVPVNTNFIGTPQQIAARAWWNVRNAQKREIEKNLEDSHNWESRKRVYSIISRKQIENLDNLLEWALTHEDNKAFSNYGTIHNDKGGKKLLWEAFRDEDILDTLEVKTSYYKSQSDWMSKTRGNWYPKSDKVPHLRYEAYDSGWMRCWFDDDSDRRNVEVEIIFRSYGDFINHLGFKDMDDLPPELKHYIYTRTGPCTGYCWDAYTGNSILEFTDPMNEIKDPWRDESYNIHIWMSKSYYNKMVKKYGNKRSTTLRLLENGEYNYS